MEKNLVEAFLNKVKNGKRAENGFKKETYAHVAQIINDVHGTMLDVQQVKNKYSSLKKKYNIFTALKNNSGFGWDEENQLPTTPVDVWERYLNANPKAREFWKKTLRYYTEFEELFVGICATGEHAIMPSLIFNTSASFAQPARSVLLDYAVDSELDHDGKTVPVPIEMQPKIKEWQQTKRVKKERISSGNAIAKALLEIKDTAKHLSFSKTEQTVSIIQEEYTDQLGMGDLVQAVSLFENVRKAEIFVTMKPGKLQDMWLEKEIQK